MHVFSTQDREGVSLGVQRARKSLAPISFFPSYHNMSHRARNNLNEPQALGTRGVISELEGITEDA